MSDSQQIGLQVAAYLFVVIITFFGGMFGYFLSKGLSVKICGRAIVILPICKYLFIPPPAFQSYTGAIIRNLFVPFLDNYPSNVGQMGRLVILGIIFLRGGLNMQFRGTGILLLFVSVIPLVAEAVVISAVGKQLFNMPNDMSIALGCLMASAGTAIIVPALVNMQGKGFGSEKRITHQLLVATVIDNIIAGTSFAISKGIVMNDYYQMYDINKSESPMVQVIYRVLSAIAIGIAVGIAFGFASFVFKLVKNKEVRHWLQFGYCLCLVVGFSVGSEFAKYPESKYVAMIITSYIMKRIYEKDFPIKKIDDLWFYTTPILYGTMGAELNFRKISAQQVWKSLVLILTTLGVRFITTFAIAAMNRSFTLKEKLFIAITWCPKGTIQAALGYGVINQILLSGHHDSEYETYGYNLLSTAILAVLVTQPLFAIIINNIGPRFLTKDLQISSQPIQNGEANKIIEKVEAINQDQAPENQRLNNDDQKQEGNEDNKDNEIKSEQSNDVNTNQEGFRSVDV